MDKLDFCPNCGNHLDSGGEFCPNCGFNLKKYESENKSISKTNIDKRKIPVKNYDIKYHSIESDTKLDKKNVPNHSKKRKVGFILISIVAILLVAGYFGGKVYYGENYQAQRLREEVTSGTSSKMKAALVDSDGKQLTTGNISALRRLYLKDSSMIRQIESQINVNQSNKVFSLKKTGKYLMFFPKYKVMIRNRSLNINTNIGNPTFFIDGKSVPDKVENGKYKISNLMPGFYDVKVENSKESNETKTKQVVIGIDNDDKSVEFEAKKVEKPAKVITKIIHEKDEDNTTSNVNDTLVADSKEPSTISSKDSLIGEYTGNPNLTLYPNGTYELGDKNGTYDILEDDNGHVKIRYNQNNGGSIVESYYYSDGELRSSKYNQSWYKK